MTQTDNEVRVLVRGDAWISGNSDEVDYWADGVSANIEVENTDHDELAVHILLDKNTSADASFYMTHHEASRLMAVLGRAVLR